MRKSSFSRWLMKAGLYSGLTLASALPLSWGMARADEEPIAMGQPVAQVQVLSLADCLRIASEKQPALQAARASLAAQQTQARALEELHAPPLVAKDLKIRRQQACLGVTVAQAALAQAERDTAYAVTRTFFTVIYARKQKIVTDEVVKNLKGYQEKVGSVVKGDDKDKREKEWTTDTVDKITVYMGLAQTKQAEATQGIERATMALREAMGVERDFIFQVPDENLPSTKVAAPVHDDIVNQALALRGELTMSDTAATIACLEVDAQGKTCKPGVVRTFAAGADIHSHQVPQGVSNGEYRPGAIPPEMPPFMAGSKANRMDRARHLHARASACADKARGLIILEAEDAYLKWTEALQKVTQSREAAAAGHRLAKNTGEAFRNQQKVTIEDLLTNEVIAGQAKGSFNEAVYQYVLALANLERVTGGGFTAGFAK